MCQRVNNKNSKPTRQRDGDLAGDLIGPVAETPTLPDLGGLLQLHKTAHHDVSEEAELAILDRVNLGRTLGVGGDHAVVRESVKQVLRAASVPQSVFEAVGSRLLLSHGQSTDKRGV